MNVKKNFQKTIKNLATNSVGRSHPWNFHEPKIPAALKAAKEKK